MIGKLPRHTLANRFGEASSAAPAVRHYEIVLDVSTALGIGSAINGGRLGDLIEHLCLGCVTDRIATTPAHQLIAIVAVDRCRRECIRCERERAHRAARVGGFAS